MIIKMPNKLRRIMYTVRIFNRELENIKKNQTDLKNMVSEVKSTLE